MWEDETAAWEVLAMKWRIGQNRKCGAIYCLSGTITESFCFAVSLMHEFSSVFVSQHNPGLLVCGQQYVR